jgi:agarase
MYVDYLTSVLKNPALVGCHWFQYVDEPLTGRYYDGENYNIGFVSVTDTPYPEMVRAAKEVQDNAYKIRGN